MMDVGRTQSVLTLPPIDKIFKQIDAEYEQIGCLGHGSFGSVFLARKRHSPHRNVAIKVLPIDGDEDLQESYQRELEAMSILSSLTEGEKEESDTDMSIVFLRGFARTPNNAFLMMNYYDGGTLANRITTATVPFAERRIAWYMLQLCEALAYAHSRNIFHHDVKSENILIDTKPGGKLVLADFGTSVRPGQDRLGVTLSYASPELLAAHRSDESLDLVDPGGVDSFGLGCIALELLACSRLAHMKALASTTVADLAVRNELPRTFACLRDGSHYSNTLRHSLTLRLLDQDPKNRLRPSDYATDLRQHQASPLLTPIVVASHYPSPRAHITMDNIQLGSFVQRGPDWCEGDLDGGDGCIGTVVRLDADALYCDVAWPTTNILTHRIGALCRMELSVSLPLPDGVSSGLLQSKEACKYEVGQYFQSSSQLDCAMNGMVVVRIEGSAILLVPPPSFRLCNDFKTIPAIVAAQSPRFVSSKDPAPPPISWDENRSQELVEVQDLVERDLVLSKFHHTTNGLQRKDVLVFSVQRVQSARLWDAYARRREVVALENWGQPNEKLLFHGSSGTEPSIILNDRVGFDPRFCDAGRFGRGSYFAEKATYSHQFAHEKCEGGVTCFQMFLARVSLGRIDVSKKAPKTSLRRPADGCHSVMGASMVRTSLIKSIVHVIYETSTQAFPEYLISYRYK